MTEPGARTCLVELDALRGIAAVLVVLFHFTWKIHAMMPGAPAVPYGLAWGAYGVHLFFAISGFVIFMTLERTRSGADFAVHRFARLFPAYWAGIGVTTLAVHLLGTPALAQPAPVVLANVTMLQGFAYLPAVDGVYWTLTVELAFYCIVTVIFVALSANALRLLVHPLLLWLGALSYPIYLVHQFMGYAVLAKLGEWGVLAWPALLTTIAVVLGVAQLLHSFVEKPALNTIRAFWRRRGERTEHATA